MMDNVEERTIPVLTRKDIEALIAQGQKLFILDQFVIKADAWVPYHPGGEKSILHMVGRDATDEVTAFVLLILLASLFPFTLTFTFADSSLAASLHSLETKRQMSRYRIGSIEGRWKNLIPPIQGGHFPTLYKGRDIDDGDAPPQSETPSSLSILDSSGSPGHIRQRTNPTRETAQQEDPGIAHLDAVSRQKIDLDLKTYPSLDPSTQDAIVAKYRLLDAHIRAEGLYDCNYAAYAVEFCRYAMLFAGMLLFLRCGWYVPSALCMGAFWHQISFFAHDAGHIGITHDFHTDSVLGILVADFMGGLSLGWWKKTHNTHHIVTNSPEHDPDIEYLPFLAVSHRFLASLRSTYYDRVMEYDAVARVCVAIQKYLYFPLLAFGRFNLYRLSWEYLLTGQAPRKGPSWWHRHLEIAGQLFFWTWYAYGIVYRSIPNNADRFLFVAISHVAVLPLHVQLALSHFAMSTADLGPCESFPQRMLRTTMDVDCPAWLDFFHGGLQFQVVHHLYPRIPRHNLRRTQKLVRAFCNDVGIPYALYGFVDGNKRVVGSLGDVSRQAAIFAKCQQTLQAGTLDLSTHPH